MSEALLLSWRCLLLLSFATLSSSRLVIPGLTHVHYDVEPHTLSEWTKDAASVGAQYVQLLASLQAALVSSNVDLGLSISMNCDMDGAQCNASLPDCNITLGGHTQPIAFHALEKVNKSVMMAYFKNSNEIILRTQAEAGKAKSLGVTFAIALNLQPSAPWSETYQDEGPEVMESAFDNVTSSFHTLLGYDLTRVIHTYGYYAAMSPIPSCSPSHELYLWCSSGTDCNIYNEASVSSWIAFAQSHGIKSVYIDAPAIVKLGESYDQELLVDVIGRFFRNGIKTELIFGVHSWALTSNHEKAVNYTRAAIKMIQTYGSDSSTVSELPIFNCSVMSPQTLSPPAPSPQPPTPSPQPFASTLQPSASPATSTILAVVLPLSVSVIWSSAVYLADRNVMSYEQQTTIRWY